MLAAIVVVLCVPLPRAQLVVPLVAGMPALLTAVYSDGTVADKARGDIGGQMRNGLARAGGAAGNSGVIF
jgi:hypothetical protein